MKSPRPWREVVIGLLLLAGVLGLRWPTFDFHLWNVDEAIHAGAARAILDGGVLYHDAIDQRTPLTYYVVAGVFAVAGENNLWAVRCLVAGVIAATAFLLYLAGRRLGSAGAGLFAAALYATLSSTLFFQGDAYAANTEWFVALFSSAGAVALLRALEVSSPGRWCGVGALFGGAFLSKQPGLLDAAAPLAALLYAAWQRATPRRAVAGQVAALVAGWLAPVLLVAGWLALRGALAEAVFYTWTYNLSYYGPEVTTADRLTSLRVPFQLLGAKATWLLAAWGVGALLTVHRLLQREPRPAEAAGNPGLAFLTVWSLAGLAGAASGGRGFDHYSIQFLAPFCLGGGLVLALAARTGRSAAARWPARAAAVLLLLAAAWQLGAGVVAAHTARWRNLAIDPARRVATYIQEHSAPADRIFVWGYHPDIYLFADRRPASRYLYASFVTGLIPWTNVAPGVDTGYAIVPGALDTLLQDLARQPPVFLVDCSAGPNRHWQKYPIENFPALHDFVRQHYKQVEAHYFLPQGYRLYQRLKPGEVPDDQLALPPLPAATMAQLTLNTLGHPLMPTSASAKHGANRLIVDGRVVYFVHAPSTISYRIPPGTATLQGGYGIMAAAYAPDNKGPTDGAEFIIRWRPLGGGEQDLLRRLLRPKDEPADRGIQGFHVALPTHDGGELELVTSPGPADNAASDWTFWTELALENSP